MGDLNEMEMGTSRGGSMRMASKGLFGFWDLPKPERLRLGSFSLESLGACISLAFIDFIDAVWTALL